MPTVLEPLMFALASLLTLVTHAAIGLAAYVLVGSLARETRLGVRLCCVMLVSGWWLIAGGLGLAAAGLFNNVTAVLWVGLLVTTATLVGRKRDFGLVAALRTDVETVRETVSDLERPGRLAIGSFGGLVALALARGMALPPLATDALTYHLVHAAAWVTTGGFAERVMPDAWTYYQHFPVGGDAISAWAMLATRGDLWVAPTWTIWWAGLFVAAYVLLRQLATSRDSAMVGAAAIAACPTVYFHASTGYVDNLMLTWTICALVFANRFAIRPHMGWVVATVATCALAIATKLSGLVVLAGAVLALALAAGRARASWVSLAKGALVGAAASVPLSVTYARAWMELGSPFEPFRLAVGPILLSEGNDLLRMTMAADLPGLATERDPGLAMYFLELGRQVAGLGFGYVVFVPAALVGIGAALASSRRHITVPLALIGAVFFHQMLSDAMAAQRFVFSFDSARLVLPAFTALVVFAHMATKGWAIRVRNLAAAMTVLSSVGAVVWQFADFTLPTLVGSVVLLAALVGGLAFAVTRRKKWQRGLVAIVAFGAFSIGLGELARAWRWKTNPEFYRPELAPFIEDDGARIAVTAGPYPTGHNWTIYPLLGSQLQNEVVHVPATTDGALLHPVLGEARAAAVDADAWLARLRAEKIDYVVLLWPAPAELPFILSRPETFEPTVPFEPGRNGLYRLRID